MNGVRASATENDCVLYSSLLAVFRAVLAHPPNTINGRFRVTEQGEMITQVFALVTT